MSKLIQAPPPQATLRNDLDECIRLVTGHGENEAYHMQGFLSQSVLDNKGRYLHWDDIYHRHHSREVALAHWSLVKFARRTWHMPVFISKTGYILTPNMQRITSRVDRQCTEAGIRALFDTYNLTYESLSDFEDEESIASSQLEGAATTRAVAKKMLQEGRKPHTESEQMIVCNRRLMNIAWERRHDKMTPELLLLFHQAATGGINDAAYHPGIFRTTDDVWVGDDAGNIIHQPPAAKELPALLSMLFQWLNVHHEDESAWQIYLHPVIKAIIAHFYIGYFHPFYDGNGRVARALCYWVLFKSGYSAFRYISISQLLKEAPREYARAYLRTETDDMDLTYFIEYQCRIIERAVNQVTEHLKIAALRHQDLQTWMMEIGLRKHLSAAQSDLLASMVYFPTREHTIRSVMEKLGISRTTARGILEQMVNAGVMTKSGGAGNTPAFYKPRRSQEKFKMGVLAFLRELEKTSGAKGGAR